MGPLWPSAPIGVVAPAVGWIGGKLYVADGGAPGIIGDVQVYDPALDSWTVLPDSADMPTPRGGGTAYGVYQDKLYVAGGTAAFEVFDPATETWDVLAPLPHGARGASGGNLLLADGVLLIATPDKLFAFDEHGKTSRLTQ